MPLTESKIEVLESRESRYNVTDSGGLILEVLLIADDQMRYRRWEAHPRCRKDLAERYRART